MFYKHILRINNWIGARCKTNTENMSTFQKQHQENVIKKKKKHVIQNNSEIILYLKMILKTYVQQPNVVSYKILWNFIKADINVRSNISYSWLGRCIKITHFPQIKPYI